LGFPSVSIDDDWRSERKAFNQPAKRIVSMDTSVDAIWNNVGLEEGEILQVSRWSSLSTDLDNRERIPDT
jgi:hypothetical protein